MRRASKYFLLVLAVGGGLLGVMIGLLFLPGVQKALLLRVLSGPETTVNVDEVRIRPGSAFLEGVDIQTPESRLRVGNLESRFRLGPLLTRRTVAIEVLSVSNLVIEIDEPEEPPEVEDTWERFEGVLPDLPVDFRLAALEVEGRFVSAAGLVATFAVEGRDLSSRGDEGRLAVEVAVADPALPGDDPWTARIGARPVFDVDGIFQALSGDVALSVPGALDQPLRADFRASRTDNGEEYAIAVSRPIAEDALEKELASVNVRWSRLDRHADGRVVIDVNSDDLPPFPGKEELPGFVLRTETVFLLSRSGQMDLGGAATLRLSKLAERFELPQRLDEVSVDAVVDLSLDSDRLDVNAFDLGVAETAGVDLVRVRAPSLLALDLSQGRDGFLPDFEDPVFLVEIPGIPAELIELFLDDLRLSAEPATAQFALYSRDGGLELEAPGPLSLRDVVLTGPDDAMLFAGDLALTPSGRVTSSDFEFGLSGEGAVLPARMVNLELRAAGNLPLKETEADIRLEASDFEDGFPVDAASFGGAVHTTHTNGAYAPAEVRFDFGVSATPEASLPVRLPDGIDLRGVLRRNGPGEFYALQQFDATLMAGRETPLVRATLEQPIAFAGYGIPEGLPQGDLLSVEFLNLRIADWLPEEGIENFSGGVVRGGLLLSREDRELRLRPFGDAIEIADLDPGLPGNGAGAVLHLSLAPYAGFDFERLRFGIDDMALETGQTLLARASLTADWVLDAGESPNSLSGSFSSEGDIPAWRTLMGEDFLPELASGEFVFQTEWQADPRAPGGTATGALSLPELRSGSGGTPFSVNVDFAGEGTASGGAGEMSLTILDADGPQEINLAADIDLGGNGHLPRVALTGASEFLDVMRLQAFAELFSGPAASEPEPVQPGPIETLLPVAIDAGFSVARMRVLPEFEVYDVRVELFGDDRSVDMRQARLRWPEEGETDLSGRAVIDGETLRLTAAGAVSGIDIEDVLRRTQGVREPDIRGRFGLDFDFSARGMQAGDLIRSLEGTLNVSGTQGHLKLTLPDGRMERVRQLTGMQEGAIGSLIARLAGAPPGVQALAESLNLLTDIPFDTFDAGLDIRDGGTLLVERMELAGPFLFVSGRGRLENIDWDATEKTPLDLRVELGTRRALRDQFLILNLLSDQTNQHGYQMLRRRPIQVTGTLGDPNLRELWDLLIDAGVGAAGARDDGRSDPVEDAVRGIRDLFGR